MSGEHPSVIAQVQQTKAFAAETAAQVLNRLRALRSAASVITDASDSLGEIIVQMDGMSTQDDTVALLEQAHASSRPPADALGELNPNDLLHTLELAEKNAAELRFVSIMTQINSVSAIGADENSSDFAKGLKRLVHVLSGTTKSALLSAKPIPLTVKSAQSALEAAALTFETQVQATVLLRESTQTLREVRDRHMKKVKFETSNLAKSITQQVSRLVPGLQFADAFTQRLENTFRFLDDSHAHPESSIEQLRGLAALQLRELAQDNCVEREVMRSALDALFEVALRANQALHKNDQESGALKWLEARERAVESNAKVIDIAQNQMRSAFAELDKASLSVAEVNDAINQFRPLVQELRVKATNGALSASQASNENKAALVLAAEVQKVANNCADRLALAVKHLEVINEVDSRIDRSGLEAEVQQLEVGVIAAKVTQETQKRLTLDQETAGHQLSGGVSELLEACRAAREAVSQSNAMEKDLLELANSLAKDGPQDAMPDIVEWVRAYYTTEAERLAHLKFIGVGAPEEADEPDVDDDLEGFVF